MSDPNRPARRPAAMASVLSQLTRTTHRIESTRGPSDQDLLSLDRVASSDWTSPVVAIRFLCSWSTPETQGPPAQPSVSAFTGHATPGYPYAQMASAGSGTPANHVYGWGVPSLPAQAYTQGALVGSTYGQIGSVPAQVPKPPRWTYTMTAQPAAGGFGQTAQSQGPPRNVPVSFHFRLFFELQNGKSVELHVQLQSVTQMSSRTLGLSRNYIVTNRNVYDRITVYPSGRQFTMADASRIVFNEGRRHRYQFHANGKGCGYWALTVLSDLERAGLLQQGSVARCNDKYREWAARWNNDNDFPANPTEGRFF